MLFQHITMASTCKSFLKDVQKSFAKGTLKNVSYIKKLPINDKRLKGMIFKERAISFYIANKDKHRWLMTKHVAIWLMHATQEQIQRVHKTITSGNISIGKRGIIFNFQEIRGIPKATQSHYFHPHSCSNALDICYHDVLWERALLTIKNLRMFGIET